MNYFVFLNFYFGAKNVRHGNSLVARRVSQGRIIIVLIWTKYAVPRQIKPGVLKSTTSRDQRNLRTVFIFVSREEKGCYRIVSLGHQNFDCRSYCGLSRRMQGEEWSNISYRVNSDFQAFAPRPLGMGSTSSIVLASIAQWLDHLPWNQGFVGSNPGHLLVSGNFYV